MHKILVVDDEAYIATMLEEYLTSMGYDVVGKASSGQKSVEMSRKLRPELVLMDIVMPGMLDGIDASQIIKKELDIPIVFLTAYADDKFIERAKNIEPLGYIVKPFQKRELKAVIEVALVKKATEDKLTASLKEKEVLLKEIHHRVKNNMQVISSMLSLQSQHITDKASLAMFQESQNRIRAMALIHEKLYTSEDLAHIDIASYIHSLTHQLITTYHTLASRVNMDIAITNIFLTITTAIPCGLIINELVSNALKHAFPHQQKGTITVSMTPSNTDSLILTVSDTGIGFPEGIDFRNTTTLGMQLVVSLVEQLEGTITLDRNEGTRFRIEFRTQE
jgi:two-component sensor histidine kinase